MREIKFRAKRVDNGEWYYWGLTGTTTKVDMKTVGEYTGLKDKNGMEIYEGDIVSKDNWIAEIVWNNYLNKGDLDLDILIVGFVLKWKDGDFSPISYNSIIDFEIIGNIYENPELIKE